MNNCEEIRVEILGGVGSSVKTMLQSNELKTCKGNHIWGNKQVLNSVYKKIYFLVHGIYFLCTGKNYCELREKYPFRHSCAGRNLLYKKSNWLILRLRYRSAQDDMLPAVLIGRMPFAPTLSIVNCPFIWPPPNPLQRRGKFSPLWGS